MRPTVAGTPPTWNAGARDTVTIVMDAPIIIATLGWLARDALVGARGRARVVASLARSAYVRAGDELIWIGAPDSPLHGRAVLGHSAVPTPLEGDVTLDVGHASVWRPDDTAGDVDRRSVADSARSMLARLGEVGTPEGFATLLTGATLRFPFDGAAPAARALALASHGDDLDAATRAATQLIGLGPGLTPAGDDFIGGVFFAHATFDHADAREKWRRAGDRIGTRARQATHPISAVLLADLIAGRGHAPLHELARDLAIGATLPASLDAARRLTRIGHSSGWDMLAGFLAALVPPACWETI